MEHQSSIRSLISRSSNNALDSRDMAREIEEFTRQIQEEGLLDGVDLDNIDLNTNDELSRKITEAYRRRHRERARREGGRRSNASAHSHRSTDGVSESRPHTGDSSRPASRHSAHSASRMPEERGDTRRPALSILRFRSLVEDGVQPAAAAAPLSPSHPLSPSPGPPLLADGSGSQVTHAYAPPEQLGNAPKRHDRGAELQHTDRHEFLAVPRGIPLPRRFFRSALVSQGLDWGITQAASSTAPEAVVQPSRRPARPSSLVIGAAMSATFGSSSGPNLSPSPSSSPRARTLRYAEPNISCNRCMKEHIEYELHYNCATCDQGRYNICLDCYRQGKGCLHWYGFGRSAWVKWENIRRTSGDAGLV